jgi:hypothetical protein
MDVKLSLKSWRVVQDEKSKLPKVVGTYAVMVGEKEVAAQNFNEGYGSKEISFSAEVVNALLGVEGVIRGELEKMLS